MVYYSMVCDSIVSRDSMVSRRNWGDGGGYEMVSGDFSMITLNKCFD